MLLAGPISHTRTQYMDFNDIFLIFHIFNIFNISLDLSSIYYANFSGC